MKRREHILHGNLSVRAASRDAGSGSAIARIRDLAKDYRPVRRLDAISVAAVGESRLNRPDARQRDAAHAGLTPDRATADLRDHFDARERLVEFPSGDLWTADADAATDRPVTSGSNCGARSPRPSPPVRNCARHARSQGRRRLAQPTAPRRSRNLGGRSTMALSRHLRGRVDRSCRILTTIVRRPSARTQETHRQSSSARCDARHMDGGSSSCASSRDNLDPSIAKPRQTCGVTDGLARKALRR